MDTGDLQYGIEEHVNRSTYMLHMANAFIVAIFVAILVIIAKLVLNQVHGMIKNLLAVNVAVMLTLIGALDPCQLM